MGKLAVLQCQLVGCPTSALRCLSSCSGKLFNSNICYFAGLCAGKSLPVKPLISSTLASIISIYLAFYFSFKSNYWLLQKWRLNFVICFVISYQYLGTHWLGRKLRLFQPPLFQPGCQNLPTSGTCTINSSLQSTSVPISVLIAIVVFVPFFLIIACYIAFVCTLKASHKKLNTSPQR